MAPPNVKIKHLTRSPSSSSGDTRFPKLDECAHFHYENVELGPIKVLLCDKLSDPGKASIVCNSSANKENEPDRLCFLVTVISNSKKWVVRRSYKNFMFLDTQLHRCVYDRKYSLLQELPNISREESEKEDFEEQIRALLSEYLERFSQLAGSLINCGPVLNWFELDNRGNRLIVTDEVAINTPAVAAAYVVVPYSALATDEISFDVGDMISVIDMPPPEESSWWRGKKGFEVGFFPSECVEVIGDKVPHSFKLSNSSTKPVFRRHGKLIAFFRSFLLSRPSRRKLKQSGILKERVFGCDLGEHLLNTGREIPMVLKCCAEFIEEYGIVDGIYRLSGVSSNIQRLRLAFDEDRPINLGDPATVHDIHSVASLLKMYFRELPNPLLTYQLYDKFVNAVQSSEDVRLLRVRDVVQQLPPPHFRTLQYLLTHLARVAAHGEDTGMTPKNIAIVWAPNLLRSRDVENGGVGALHVVGVQAVLTEYLIRFSDLIFDEKVSMLSGSEQEGLLRARPKSLAISTPTKLLSLEEARARALSTHLPPSQQKYIEVGGGPDKLPSKYHTVIELPLGKQGLPKLKKSPSGWKSFFSRGWYSGSTREKSRPSFRTSRKASTSSLPHHSAYMQEKPATETDTPYNHRKKLRTVKSAESLAHCLKESSPHSTNKEGLSGENSCKSSPQVSVDSANSLDMTSPLSKSPGLQKHTRSSSHESYFESNSMDIISEPSFEEDEHGLFYYVSEQMRILQNSDWESDRNKVKEDSVSMRSSESVSAVELPKKVSPRSDLAVEKYPRKQKLTIDEDFDSQAKFQKLNEIENSLPITSTVCYKNSSSSSRDDSVFDDKDNGSHHFDDTENYSWSHQYQEDIPSEHDLTLDPIQLYESVKNKRMSVISSSDNDTDPSDKTVIERYGNAETVLVEVHATQDSSSEEDQYSPKLSDNVDNVFHSIYDPILNTFEADNTLSCFSENSPETETQELQFHLSDEDDGLLPVLNENKGTLFVEEHIAPIVEEHIAPIVEEHTSKDLEVFSDSDQSEEHQELNCYQYHPDDKTINEGTVSEEELKVPIKPCETEKISISPSVTEVPKKPTDLKLDIQKSEFFAKQIESNNSSQSFSINSPPSPVYPPKSLRSPEFQSLKTKVENIPLHNKKKLFNIPSPSSPVEEVRKKFELKASNSRKNIESPTNEVKFRCHVRELPSKLSKALSEAKESSEPISVVAEPEIYQIDSRLKISPPTEPDFAKRHSEPPPKNISVNSPPNTFKRMSNKYEGDNTSKTPKSICISEKVNTRNTRTVQQPSLFTQLKIRKLQSLQAESPSNVPEPIDPWSDPILDMQEDYHPIVSYLPTHSVDTEDMVEDSNSTMDELTSGENEESCIKQGIDDFDHPVNQPESHQEQLGVSKVEPTILDDQVAGQNLTEKPLNVGNEIENLHLSFKLSDNSPESEAVRRERINRIKEERRAQLREKLKQESFRMEAEEKEKVQTKFRLRKDCSKHCSTGESHEDVKKSDKAVETDSANITETGTTCDLDSSVESNIDSHVSPTLVKSEVSSGTDSGLESFSFSPKISKSISKELSPVQKSSGRKSARSYEDSRKWLSMPPTDIRDKVAMFERSKDTNELCRLGPNGKFPQKQGTSALASSFVR